MPRGRAATGAFSTLVSRRQLEQFVDPLVLFLARREQRTRIEHVAPQAPRGNPGPVGQHQVLAHRQSHEQLGLLERPGQPPAGPRPARHVGDVVTVQLDPTAVRPQQPRQHGQQGRLPGAVRSDQAGDLPGLDLDAHRGQRRQPAEADRDVTRASAGTASGVTTRAAAASLGADVTRCAPPPEPWATGPTSDAGEGRQARHFASTLGREMDAATAGARRLCSASTPSGYLATEIAPRPKSTGSDVAPSRSGGRPARGPAT